MSSSERFWRPIGTKASMVTDNLRGVRYDPPVIVTVVGFDDGSKHPIKVVDHDNVVHYVAMDDLVPPTSAQATAESKRQTAKKKVITTAVDARMKQIEKKLEEEKEMQKPSFDDVERKFYALHIIQESEKGLGNDDLVELVMSLAKKALFDEMKDGVTWG